MSPKEADNPDGNPQLKYSVLYGSRLIMMHKGDSVIDVRGEEKKRLDVSHLLKVFNEISVECGN